MQYFIVLDEELGPFIVEEVGTHDTIVCGPLDLISANVALEKAVELFWHLKAQGEANVELAMTGTQSDVR